jgi:hypothetical protein
MRVDWPKSTIPEAVEICLAKNPHKPSDFGLARQPTQPGLSAMARHDRCFGTWRPAVLTFGAAMAQS